MSRRIFLNSGNFSNASLIFTKIIWKKDTAAVYRKALELSNKQNQLFYSLAIYHDAIFDLQKARGSEKFLVLTAELNETDYDKKKKSTSTLTYQIESSTVVNTERILEDEVNIYQVKANLVSQSGNLALPVEAPKSLVFTIKPGLSATIPGKKEIYLSFNQGKAEHF